METIIFKDRKEAGQLLAGKLLKYIGSNTVVLGVPRGGIPVAYEIAKKLGADLDIALAKKIGHPMNPEYAIGSVSLNTVVINPGEEVPEDYLKKKIKELQTSLTDKYKLYRGNKAPLNLKGKTVIITDDGIATGSTLLATIQMLRKSNVNKIVVASPVVPADRVDVIKKAADDFIYLYAPKNFIGVGAFYENFDQISDAEAMRLLSSITRPLDQNH